MQDRCVKMQDRQAAADTFEAKIKGYRARAFDSDLQVHLRIRHLEKQGICRDTAADPSLWVKEYSEKIQAYRARALGCSFRVSLNMRHLRKEGIWAEPDEHYQHLTKYTHN